MEENTTTELHETEAVPSEEMANLDLESGIKIGGPTSKTPTIKIENSSPKSSNTLPNSTAANFSFRETFKSFSKFGDPKSDGKHITLSQSDKWMKQAKVIDGKKITTTDTGIYFKKLKSMKVTLDEYERFLQDLARNKKVDVGDIKSKMSICGQPGLSGAGGTSKTAATVERLTDPSKYTGSHKQRFDEAGKGKGIAGRKDVTDASGYVSGYQNKDTYNKTH